MSLADALTTFQARCQANVPELAVGGTSRAFGYARSFLSATDDITYLVSQSAPNLSWQTASYEGLLVLAGNYGVTVSPGTAASASVVFSLSSGTATGSLVIPAGTLVSTVGDGLTTFAQYFTTQAAATISSGASSSSAVTATATVPGIAGNVSAGAISVLNTQGLAGAYTVTNAAPATGGVDPDTATQIRAKIAAAVQSKYAAAAIQAAALTVPGIYDAYVADPLDGSGAFAVYNGDTAGVVASGALLTSLQAAVMAVSPAAIKAASVTYPAFTVQNVTALALTYSAPTAVQSSVIQPLIQAGAKEYIQGNSATGYSGVIHGQVPTAFGLYAYVQGYVGYQLSNLVVTSATPNFLVASPSNTTLWRLNGSASTVVTVTRV